ncbi:MAG: cob(I)yrinic acid a,c-diamide adenosyltransferase [Opitutaceae bacterium]|nr:cob(I)yrinic acid a,c-diamide adenosyltransferase [Cytophagales bacterium]
MKIYTKTGDKGFTSLIGGKKVSKGHLRIEAYGSVDELNSYIGLLAAYTINEPYSEFLTKQQHKLFNIGSILALEEDTESKISLPEIQEQDVLIIESEIDKLTELLPPLKNFILPGGHREVAFCHIARCVCRRAEREVVRLNENVHIDEIIIHYLNRLSDYLFVLARIMTVNLGSNEIIWVK